MLSLPELLPRGNVVLLLSFLCAEASMAQSLGCVDIHWAMYVAIDVLRVAAGSSNPCVAELRGGQFP